MPITLSNGTYLNDTGQTDARGFPTFYDNQGNIYTKQGSSIVLSRRADEVDQSLIASGQADFLPIVGETRGRLREAMGIADFDYPEIGGFRDQAESDVGAFFDKDLEFLERKLTMQKKQYKEKVDVSRERLGEDKQSFFKTEDIDFARAMEAAQGGFAGRETMTSGFRLKSIGQDIQDRETDLGLNTREFARTGEDIDIGERQFGEQQSYTEDYDKFIIERQKQEKILQQQQLLQQQEINKKKAAQSEAIDFIRQRLG